MFPSLYRGTDIRVRIESNLEVTASNIGEFTSKHKSNQELTSHSNGQSWRQKPRHTLLGHALEGCRVGPIGHVSAALRRLTPTKHTAGPLWLIVSRPSTLQPLDIKLITYRDNKFSNIA